MKQSSISSVRNQLDDLLNNMTQSHNGEATHNRDADKYRIGHDEALGTKLHKDTEANTSRKRQVSVKDLPVGMRSKTIYGLKS